MNTEACRGHSTETVRTALACAFQELTDAGVEAPRLTAELLLAHTLGWDRIRVLCNQQTPLSEEQKDSFLVEIGRRARGEPLQFITGEQEFYGLPFCVTPAVLIPRPETEILVERAVQIALCQDLKKELNFVDVGTGSGCVAIAFAKQVPHSVGWAVDIAPEALAIARQNAARHSVTGQIQFVCGDLLAGFSSAPRFDFILSNPPYVARRDARALPELVRDHEPAVALFGGEFGLEVYERLIPQAATRLKPEGYFIVEVGAGQSDDVARLMQQAGLFLEDILADLQRIPRCVVARRKE